MSAITELINIDYVQLFIAICTLMFGLKAVWSLFEWFIVKFGLETKAMRKRREDHDTLIQTVQNLATLQQKHEDDNKELKECLSAFITETRSGMDELRSENMQYSENRIHDRQQSFGIQHELVAAQESISQALETLNNKFDEMQRTTDERFVESEERNNKRLRADLKNKISNSYRYYHEKGEINYMELEALEDLIESYEDASGTNSFVHEVVQKEMYTWKLIDKDDWFKD